MLWGLKKKANIEAKEEPKKDTNWITVNGVHIPIKKGQDKDDVVKGFLNKQKDDEPKKRNYDVGVVSDKKKLDIADKILNDLPNDFVSDHKIKFNDSARPHSQGSWQFHQVEISLNNIPDSDIGAVISHELGHANFSKNKEWDIVAISSVAMTSKSISSYSKGYHNEVISTQEELKNTRRTNKALPEDATDEEKRIARVKLENAEIDYNQALKSYAHEFYADLQSLKHGYSPKTKTDVTKEEIDSINKYVEDTLKNPENKANYQRMFPSLTKSIESICPECGEPNKESQRTKQFSFDEVVDEHWKEYEHYLHEDATNSGQKSDTVGNPEFKSFTHSSSFIGNVLWDRESLEMDILLNGKKYHFCDVSERLFDSFEGANSKGAYFNRIIKGLHDC